jgi:hypothetical protein
MSTQPSSPTHSDPLQAAQYLTLRDRLLLSWLAEVIAAHSLSCSGLASPTSRNALARKSAEYVLGRAMTPSPHRMEPSHALASCDWVKKGLQWAVVGASSTGGRCVRTYRF